jgi:hypothetical protein
MYSSVRHQLWTVAPKGVVAAAVAARNKAEEDDEPVLVPITKNFSFKRRSTSFWEDSDVRLGVPR